MMKFKDPVGLSAAIGAGILVSFVSLPVAHGELVYEDERAAVDAGQAGAAVDAAGPAAANARSEDRQLLRQTLSSSQKAQNTLSAERAVQSVPTTVVRPVIQVQPVVQSQPVYAAPPPVVAVSAPAQGVAPAPAAPGSVHDRRYACHRS